MYSAHFSSHTWIKCAKHICICYFSQSIIFFRVADLTAFSFLRPLCRDSVVIFVGAHPIRRQRKHTLYVLLSFSFSRGRRTRGISILRGMCVGSMIFTGWFHINFCLKHFRPNTNYRKVFQSSYVNNCNADGNDYTFWNDTNTKRHVVKTG